VATDKRKEGEKKGLPGIHIRQLCYMSVFVAIIAVSAQIIIPLPHGVPMTLQTFTIALAGILLGPKKGGLTVLIYILLGGVGVPVFAGFLGGLGVIFGFTGGFIMSFPLFRFFCLDSFSCLGRKRKNALKGRILKIFFVPTLYHLCLEPSKYLAFYSFSHWKAHAFPHIPYRLMNHSFLSNQTLGP